MRGSEVLRFGALACAVALSLGLGRGADADTIVYSNSSAPGDLVVGTSPDASMAIGSSGWLYNNVRTGGTVGIRTDYPRNGNGSVMFTTNGASTAKADVELYNLTTGFGKVSDLTAFSYSWYRDSVSTVTDASIAPALRLYVTDGTHSGYMVWEPYRNNGSAAAPTNTWVTSDAYNGGNGIFWTTGTLPHAGVNSLPATTFNDLMTTYGMANYTVIGISSGVGSNWVPGTFQGAIDGITIGFNHATPTVYNFEVVPEPSSIVLSVVAGGLGLLEVARRRLRRAD